MVSAWEQYCLFVDLGTFLFMALEVPMFIQTPREKGGLIDQGEKRVVLLLGDFYFNSNLFVEA